MISIYNIAITDADTEYSQALPAGTVAFSIKCRTSAAIRVAFETGKVAGSTAPFLSIAAGTVLNSPVHGRYSVGAATVYVAAASGSLVAELIVFHN